MGFVVSNFFGGLGKGGRLFEISIGFNVCSDIGAPSYDLTTKVGPHSGLTACTAAVVFSMRSFNSLIFVVTYSSFAKSSSKSML